MKKSEQDAMVAYIDKVGGPVPGLVNEQTGRLGTLADLVRNGVKQDNLALADELVDIQTKINDANLKIGDKLGEKKGLLNMLRAQVLGFSVEDDTVVTPPSTGTGTKVTPGADGGLPDYVPGTGTHTFIGFPNTPYWFRCVNGGRNVSFQAGAAANEWCSIAVSDKPGKQPAIADGKGTVNVSFIKAGEYVCMMTTTGGAVDFRYSVQP
jgi:hypothetical protein